jgi:hypothetical protein
VTIFSDFFYDFRSSFQKKSELALYMFIERFDFFGRGRISMTGNVEPEKNNGKKQRIAMIFGKFCKEDAYQSAPVTTGRCFHGTFCCRRCPPMTTGKCHNSVVMVLKRTTTMPSWQQKGGGMSINNDLILFGLDLGFGDVKLALSMNFENSPARKTILFKFPTAIAYARDGIIGDLGKDEKKYAFNGKNYFVGNSALQCREVFSTRDIDFLLGYSPLLAYAAIEKALQSLAGAPDFETLAECKKYLCLGMPLAHFHSKRAPLMDIMKKSHVSDSVLTFDAIDIRAQGQGILFDYVLDDAGQPIPDRLNLNILVVDIGFNTVDILGVVNGRPSREWSGMLDRGGISRIGEQVGNFLQREFNFELPEQALKDVLQKKEIALYGASKDISWQIRKASEEYAAWLLQEIRSRWEGFLKTADRLILAGGGAYYVQDAFQSAYRQGFLKIMENPEFSNAIGFQKYLEADHD